MKGHGAHPFLRMHVQPMLYPHIKTAWEYCYLFISGWAFGDACFLMSGNKSSRLFLYIKSNADFGGLIGKKDLNAYDISKVFFYVLNVVINKQHSFYLYERNDITIY